MDINWSFARNEGGRETGFHEAGVETFKGNIERYLARELIQNSLDARYDPNKPVVLAFERTELQRQSIPDMDGLRGTLARCAEYWQDDKKAREFFRRADAIASKPKVVALRVGDYNTTGVCGSDTDRRNNWYNLIRCAGSSSKGGGEGGSFGIGKNAPFAASYLRTVLYSTCNKDDEYVFQGVATLASHTHPDGGVAQPTGYLGANGLSVRKQANIPPPFLRKEYGTDITILGFPDEPRWADDLMYSVLDNFWPAIHFGDLEVRVGEHYISRDSLRALLEQYSAREDFTAHLYFRAFTEATQAHHDSLPRLKGVSLYLLSGDVDLPKKVAMVRKTGMKIFERHFRSVIPFCGVFICRNDEGNKKLREMEPPRHDIWDADHPEKGANKKIETEYLGFIRSCVKKLTPADDAKVLSIPGLHRFLPDDDQAPETSFTPGDETEESLNRRQLPEKIEAGRLATSKRAMQRDKARDEGAEGETAEGEGDEARDGAGGRTNSGDGGSPGKDREEETQRGVRSGGKGGFGSRPAIPVRYRTYGRNLSAGVYALNLQPETRQPVDANVLLWTVGDDQRAHADVVAARLVTGEAVPVSGGVIGPLRLVPSQSLRLEVVLRNPIKTAMEVSAHEA